ncbi:unnamed protein product [Gongylonema pulchrum]|uniref:TPR_REGION domain-containing protein n=1 Tax=Gongylonema pulchrum TaxID=637853 RepID=A0A3P6UI65_9BILA|nr:unnamed protein product [Gongylonema pulchrum]
MLGDHSGLAKAHGNLGNTYKAIGNFDSAYEHVVAHLRLAREIGDKVSAILPLLLLKNLRRFEYHCQSLSFYHWG